MQRSEISLDALHSNEELMRVYFFVPSKLFDVLKAHKFGKTFSIWLSELIIRELEDEDIIKAEESEQG